MAGSAFRSNWIALQVTSMIALGLGVRCSFGVYWVLGKEAVMDLSLDNRFVTVEDELVLELQVLQFLVLYLQRLLVRQCALNISNTHVVFVLI